MDKNQNLDNKTIILILIAIYLNVSADGISNKYVGAGALIFSSLSFTIAMLVQFFRKH